MSEGHMSEKIEKLRAENEMFANVGRMGEK